MLICYLHNLWEQQSIMDKNLFENTLKEYIKDRQQKLDGQPLISKIDLKIVSQQEKLCFFYKNYIFLKAILKNLVKLRNIC